MKWISVKDELPEAGHFVLCTYDDAIDYWHQLIKEHDGGGKPKMNNGYVVRQLVPENVPKGVTWADEGVTHWMPLPEPPKE